MKCEEALMELCSKCKQSTFCMGTGCEALDTLQELVDSVSDGSLTLNEYQTDALRTRREDSGHDTLIECAMGLSGEAGEVTDHIKKYAFHGHDLNEEGLLEELGDSLWYIAVMADEIGCTLEDVAMENVIKLQTRYPDGFSEERSRNRKEYGQAVAVADEILQKCFLLKEKAKVSESKKEYAE